MSRLAGPSKLNGKRSPQKLFVARSGQTKTRPIMNPKGILSELADRFAPKFMRDQWTCPWCDTQFRLYDDYMTHVVETDHEGHGFKF
eukprot:g20633.t1